MKKIIKTFILLINLLFYIENVFCSETEKEERAKNLIEKAILKSLKDKPLPLFKKEDIKFTKSQKPVSPMLQSASFVSLYGIPIEEKSFQNEIVIKRIVPGQDGRKRINQTDVWPHSVHGIVAIRFRNMSLDSYGFGSGTLIASNLVLTAAHNLYERELFGEEQTGRATEIRFLPAIDGHSLPFRESKVKQFYYPDEYVKNGKEDYGLLVLENSIGDFTGFFGLGIIPEELSEKLEVNITGYPADKVKNKPKYYEMWSMKGPIKNIKDDLLHYEIDTYKGQSGSSVWYKDGQDYFVIGVHIQGDELLKVNKATFLTESRFNQIEQWAKLAIMEKRDLKGVRWDHIEKLELGRKFNILDIFINMFRKPGLNYVINEENDFIIPKLIDYNFSQLKKLKINNCLINDSQIEILAHSSSITNLKLHNYRRLVEFLSAQSRVEFLPAQISSHTWQAFAQNKVLKKLSLQNYHLEDQDAQSLAMFIAHNHNNTLTHLDLSKNNIGDLGIQAFGLSISLAQNTTLTKLDLTDNIITRKGLEAFKQAMSALPRFNQLLNLSCNIISPSVEVELSK